MTMAEGPVSFEVNLGHGALICDYPESVLSLLEVQGATVPADCGQFQTQTGAPVLVTIMGSYEIAGITYLVSRFMFLVEVPWGNPIQYGFWGGDIPKPVGQDL